MEYPLPVVRENGMGKSKDKHVRVKRMYYEKQRNIIIPTHPEEDMKAMRKD